MEPPRGQVYVMRGLSSNQTSSGHLRHRNTTVDKLLHTRRGGKWNYSVTSGNDHIPIAVPPSSPLSRDEVDTGDHNASSRLDGPQFELHPVGGDTDKEHNVQLTGFKTIVTPPGCGEIASGHHEMSPGSQTQKSSSSGEVWDRQAIQDQRMMCEMASKNPYRCFHICITLYSIISYLADVGSDIYLATAYYNEGYMAWFTLTVIFISVPSLLMSIFSLYWYYHDYKNKLDIKRSCINWAYRIIAHLFLLAPMVRYTDCIYYGCKSGQRSNSDWLDHYKLMIYEDADSAMLRMMDCFMEAGPQLILQLSIILTTTTPGSSQLDSFNFKFTAQIVACITSWISISWCMTAYHSALRSTRPEKCKMTNAGMILMCLWKLGVLASRILAIVLFATVHRNWLIFILICHYIIMLIYIVFQKTNFCDGRCRCCKEFLYNMVIAVIYCFEFLNVKEGHTRKRYCLYYLILYAENVVMVVVWYSQPRSCCTHEVRLVLLVVVLASFWVGIFFMAIYYLKFHPTSSIRVCLGRDEVGSWEAHSRGRTSPSPDTKVPMKGNHHNIPPVTLTYSSDNKDDSDSQNGKKRKKIGLGGWEITEGISNNEHSSISFQDSDPGRLASTASQFTAEISTYSYEAEPRLTAI